MAHIGLGNHPAYQCEKDISHPHNLILYKLPYPLVNAAFARGLLYNISILYTGEFYVTDKNSLEKLRAEYEQKIAEMELRHKQEIALLKEE